MPELEDGSIGRYRVGLQSVIVKMCKGKLGIWRGKKWFKSITGRLNTLGMSALRDRLVYGQYVLIDAG